LLLYKVSSSSDDDFNWYFILIFVTANMIFTKCSLVTAAVKSARKTKWLSHHQNMCKQPSNSYRKFANKKTDLKIHTELSNNKRLYSNFTMGCETVLPKQAQVVICGAGTVANSVAFHLVQNGWNDILVLEQKKWDNFTLFDDLVWFLYLHEIVLFSGKCIHLYFFCVSTG